MFSSTQLHDMRYLFSGFVREAGESPNPARHRKAGKSPGPPKRRAEWLVEQIKQHYGQIFVLGMCFRKCVLPEGLAKEFPRIVKVLNESDLIDCAMVSPSCHMQSRCKRHPRFIQTRPRLVLKGPGAGQ